MEPLLLLFYANFVILGVLFLLSLKVKNKVLTKVQEALFFSLLALCILNKFYALFLLLVYASIYPWVCKYLERRFEVVRRYPLTTKWLLAALPLFLYSLTTSNLLLKIFLGLNLLGILVLWWMGVDAYA